MSYARFGVEDSDVYVFIGGDGLECCGCILGYIEPIVTKETAKMIGHLEFHRRMGHTVPQSCIDGLALDAVKNEAFLATGVWP